MNTKTIALIASTLFAAVLVSNAAIAGEGTQVKKHKSMSEMTFEEMKAFLLRSPNPQRVTNRVEDARTKEELLDALLFPDHFN